MSRETSRYTAHLDLGVINDAHILAIGRVPANSRVLDLGAADGSIARMLREMGCRVWGVEIDPVAANEAAEHCEEVVVEDLYGLDLEGRFGGQRFDVVLMLDILEHLSDPAAVLRRVAGVVADGGWGVISLPNVAHLSVRLALLAGQFTYRDAGLLDRTHLRFFDRAGVDELLDQAGWGMFDLARVTRRLGTTEIPVDDPDPDLVEQLHADTEAVTFQFVISCAPLGSAALQGPPVLPAAAAQSAYLEAVERLSELEAEVGRLRREHIPDLMDQLEAIRQGSFERCTRLRDLMEVTHVRGR